MKIEKFANTLVALVLCIFVWITVPADNAAWWPLIWRFALTFVILWCGATRSFAQLPGRIWHTLKSLSQSYNKAFDLFIVKGLLEIDRDQLDLAARRTIDRLDPVLQLSDENRYAIQRPWRSYLHSLVYAALINTVFSCILGNIIVNYRQLLGLPVLLFWTVFSSQLILAFGADCDTQSRLSHSDGAIGIIIIIHFCICFINICRIFYVYWHPSQDPLSSWYEGAYLLRTAFGELYFSKIALLEIALFCAFIFLLARARIQMKAIPLYDISAKSPPRIVTCPHCNGRGITFGGICQHCGGIGQIISDEDSDEK